MHKILYKVKGYKFFNLKRRWNITWQIHHYTIESLFFCLVCAAGIKSLTLS